MKTRIGSVGKTSGTTATLKMTKGTQTHGTLFIPNPVRKIPKTMGEWYQFSFYNNLDNDLRAGRAMTYGPIGGKTISVTEGYRIVVHARAEGWLPPLCSALV